MIELFIEAIIPKVIPNSILYLPLLGSGDCALAAQQRVLQHYRPKTLLCVTPL